MSDDERIARHLSDMAAMETAVREERWAMFGAAASLLFLLLFALGGCSYLDAAHAIKEEGKARAAILNDHYADDVAALPRTIPAGALARMPAGTEKCALSALAGLALIECQFVAVPGWTAPR